MELLGQMVYSFENFIAFVQLPSKEDERVYTPSQL